MAEDCTFDITQVKPTEVKEPLGFSASAFNVEDSNDTYVHIVGGGTGDTQKNIHTLTWAGEAWYQGDVYVGSTSGTNKDAGSQKLATETLVNTKQNQILSGTTDPSNSLGVNGDVYIKYSA